MKNRITFMILFSYVMVIVFSAACIFSDELWIILLTGYGMIQVIAVTIIIDFLWTIVKPHGR